MFEKKLTDLIESIEVNGYSRKVTKFSISKTKKEGWYDSLHIQLEFLSEAESIDKFYNKWYFRFYNKFIEEFTNSEEEYTSMKDNNSEVNFHNAWLAKLVYDIRGIYLKLNLSEMEAYIRDKKITELLK